MSVNIKESSIESGKNQEPTEDSDVKQSSSDDNVEIQTSTFDSVVNQKPIDDSLEHKELIVNLEKNQAPTVDTVDNIAYCLHIQKSEDVKNIDNIFNTKVNENAYHVGITKSTSFNLSKYITKLENVLIDVRLALEKAQLDEKELDREMHSLANAVENQCATLTEAIDHYRVTLIDRVQENTDKRMKIVKDRKENIKNQLLIVSSVFEALGGSLGSANKNLLGIEFPTLSSYVQEIMSDKKGAIFSFEKNTLDIPEIQRQIGYLWFGTMIGRSFIKSTRVSYVDADICKQSAQVVHRFPLSKLIGDIVAVGLGEAWITDEESHIITKYNTKGEEIDKVDTTVHNECFVIDHKGNFLVCDYWDCQIIKISPAGDVSVLIKDLQAHPTGICINNDMDIVICLQNTPWIPIYSEDGIVKKRYLRIFQQDEYYDEGTENNDRDSLRRNNPYRIIQNSRHDYIVVDAAWPYQVISLDVDGNYKWKYIVDQVDEGYPFNLCLSRNDELIFADIENQLFHIIDRDGQLIGQILYKDVGLVDAWSMSMDYAGQLWTGQDDGKVTIIDLQSNVTLKY